MKSLRKIAVVSLCLVVILAVSYMIGPKASFPTIDANPTRLTIPLQQLDKYIYQKEAQIADLKPDNEARIIWADTTKEQTPYSLVYMHGFSASQEEGDPIHTDLARKYGMNLYLPRLHDHGRLDSNTFKGLTPQQLVDSGKEAIAIGKLLGEKVLLLSCSTGGTLSAILAPNDDAVVGQIMLSPNIDIYDETSELITGPWGEEIMTAVLGGKYNRISYDSLAQAYWNSVYHTDGVIALKYLIEAEMREEKFSKIEIPTYVGVYFKNDKEQDKVISVKAAKRFYENIATEPSQKQYREFSTVGRHVMTSHVFSEDLEAVEESVDSFMQEVIGLLPLSI